MAENIFDEKGIIKSEYEMFFEQRMSMNANNDSVDRPKDIRTDFGKGITFKTCDGKDAATMEEVMQYNQMFYDRMMNKIDDPHIENSGMHR